MRVRKLLRANTTSVKRTGLFSVIGTYAAGNKTTIGISATNQRD